MRYSKKMLAAFEDTIQVYEQAIADIDNDKPHLAFEAFRDYGGLCRMCCVAPSQVLCLGCLINPCDGSTTDKTRTIVDLEQAIRLSQASDLRSALVARLEWLLEKAESNGIVMIARSQSDNL